MHGRQTPRLRDAQHLADDEAVVLEELQQRAIVAEIPSPWNTRRFRARNAA
jgi:hypothetical protein